MDDLIRRDAVLDTVVNMRLRGDTNDIDDFCALLLECFAVLPTAEQRAVTMKLEIDKDWLKRAMENAELTLVAEPRTGRWIDGNEGKWNTVYCPKCSVCGTPFYGIETVRYHYCPNCGVKMEESE